jgi:Tol biopolymer transport system component
MNADGTAQTRLSDGTADDSDPAWSPDGNRIAFRSDRAGNGDIYVMRADGTGVTLLTNNAREPAWSPDGSRIAFTRPGGNWDIYVMNANGTGLIRVTDDLAIDGVAAWRP